MSNDLSMLTMVELVVYRVPRLPFRPKSSQHIGSLVHLGTLHSCRVIVDNKKYRSTTTQRPWPLIAAKNWYSGVWRLTVMDMDSTSLSAVSYLRTNSIKAVLSPRGFFSSSLTCNPRWQSIPARLAVSDGRKHNMVSILCCSCKMIVQEGLSHLWILLDLWCTLGVISMCRALFYKQHEWYSCTSYLKVINCCCCCRCSLPCRKREGHCCCY